MRGVASYHKMKQDLSEVGSEIRNVGGKLIRAGRQKQWEDFNKISRELGMVMGGSVGGAGWIDHWPISSLPIKFDRHMTSKVF